MGGALNALQQHANTRRNQEYEIEENLTKIEKQSDECSQFYLACRNNQLATVEKLLKSLSQDEIDRVEPNGSTALHAACFYGNYDIVELLLKKGADRAIFNIHNCLPFDEAKTDKIKELFFRIPQSNRLVSNTGNYEWDLIDDEAHDNAQQERFQIKSIFDNATGTTPIEKMFEKIEKNYIQSLKQFQGIENIQRFFKNARNDLDPIWIVKAYTAETDFYKILNQDLAGGEGKYHNERKYIIALLRHHPALEKLNFIGLSYRILEVNYHDLAKYQSNSILMTKTFVSSSIDRKLAELFLYRKAQSQETPKTRKLANGAPIKSWLMCIYKIKHRRTALHIENYSQYANEGEILIMPFALFQVKSVRQVPSSTLPKDSSMTEIQLEEI